MYKAKLENFLHVFCSVLSSISLTFWLYNKNLNYVYSKYLNVISSLVPLQCQFVKLDFSISRNIKLFSCTAIGYEFERFGTNRVQTFSFVYAFNK